MLQEVSAGKNIARKPGTYAEAEVQLLSGEQLELSGAVSAYISSVAGDKAIRDLGATRDPCALVAALNHFAEAMSRFEFGFYRELGFSPFKEELLPPLEIAKNGLSLSIHLAGSGYYGSVYRVRAKDSDTAYALKVFYPRASEDSRSGPWNETAVGIYVTAHGVCNMPHLCIAHPSRGWFLSEFVDDTFESSNPWGPTWGDLGLYIFDDWNTGNDLLGKDRLSYRVDYGHLGRLEEPDRPVRAGAFKSLATMGGGDYKKEVSCEKLLELYRSDPVSRKYLLEILVRIPEERRLSALREMCDYPEARFYPIQDYLRKNVLPASATLELFHLLIKNPDPLVRGQAIFDIRPLPKEQADFLLHQWRTSPEFEPFAAYLFGSHPQNLLSDFVHDSILSTDE